MQYSSLWLCHRPFLVVWLSGFWFSLFVAYLEVENLTGASLQVVDGNQSFTLAPGQARFPVQATNVVFSSGTNYSFALPVTSSRMEVTVGQGTYTAVECATFEASFFMGMAWAIPVMGVCIGLRMVKQLGYHSQDI